MKRALTAAAVTALALAGGTGVAAASPTQDATQRQVDAVLAAHPGGVQTGKGVISWKNGVGLKLGAAAAGEEACPSDSLCLWEHNFDGRLVSYPGSLCGLNLIFNLKDVGFNDMASSWANHTTTRFGAVWDDYGAGGSRLWQMFPGLSAKTLPKEFNDKASSLTC
jgi:peptidase inhibitor family I36